MLPHAEHLDSEASEAVRRLRLLLVAGGLSVSEHNRESGLRGTSASSTLCKQVANLTEPLFTKELLGTEVLESTDTVLLASF